VCKLLENRRERFISGIIDDNRHGTVLKHGFQSVTLQMQIISISLCVSNTAALLFHLLYFSVCYYSFCVFMY